MIISPTPIHRQQPEPLIQSRMLFMVNSDSTIQMSLHNLRLIQSCNLFLIFYCPILVSLNFLILTGAAPSVVFCSFSPPASRFEMLCVQKWSSAYKWLFELLLPSCRLKAASSFSSDINKV